MQQDEARALQQTGFDDAALSSMGPASSGGEHIQGSLMKVPGLLGPQLLTSDEVPVLTAPCFQCPMPSF